MSLLAEIALLVVATIAVFVCLALLPRTASPPRRAATNRRTARPEQLIALERLVSSAATSTLQVHAYVRPLLVDIAEQRLAARGQTLARLGEASGRELMGERLWEILRPGRALPEDRGAPGLSTRELNALVETLDRL